MSSNSGTYSVTLAKNDLVVYTSYGIKIIKDQNKKIRDFYLKEFKILNENDKK